MRNWFLVISALLTLLFVASAIYFPKALLTLLVIGPLWAMAIRDFFQSKHAIRRNFPLLGRFRYWLETIRPEINQYFIENNRDGRPFSREQRSIIFTEAR